MIKKKADLTPITYEELNIIPVKDFDYSTYNKVVTTYDFVGLVSILWCKVRKQFHKGSLGIQDFVHHSLHQLGLEEESRSQSVYRTTYTAH